MKNRKLPIIILSVLVCLNIAITSVLCVRLAKMSADEEITGYTLYVGLNDKDTYTQKVSDDEAEKIIEDICTKHTDGVTINTAKGVWTDGAGEKTYENTAVCYFSGCDRATVKEIADELITALNQSCILIKTETETVEYYYGGTQ